MWWIYTSILWGAHERREGLPAGLCQAPALIHGGKQAAALALAELYAHSRRAVYLCCSERSLQRREAADLSTY